MTACVVFALSPLVVWTYSSFTASPVAVRTPETIPEGPTRPGVVPPGSESSTTTPDTQPPVGPSARFGGDTTGRDTGSTFPDSPSISPNEDPATNGDSASASDTAPSSSTTTTSTTTSSTETTVVNRAAGASDSTSPTSILEAIGAPIIEHPLTTVFVEAPDEQTERTTSSVSGPCHPDYSGCVPIVIDVDCADGDGDGPVFVEGPILVTGNDIYLIDANNDRIACFDGDAAARDAAADG